jgi:hypothetical protein
VHETHTVGANHVRIESISCTARLVGLLIIEYVTTDGIKPITSNCKYAITTSISIFLSENYTTPNFSLWNKQKN